MPRDCPVDVRRAPSRVEKIEKCRGCKEIGERGLETRTRTQHTRNHTGPPRTDGDDVKMLTSGRKRQIAV